MGYPVAAADSGLVNQDSCSLEHNFRYLSPLEVRMASYFTLWRVCPPSGFRLQTSRSE